MHAEPMGDFPLEGDRSTMWLMRYVRDHGGTFDGRQTKWALEHKVERNSTAHLMHDLWVLALDLGVCYDQLDVSNIGSFEVISRICQLCEETTGSWQVEGLER
ncbi:unnamed protein product [Prorocentrum cordatum]|uniref:Uncharacterized protein n=1 Tax=Prorocentrum cordatum TaxID=2364126 RepID=A0ABN9W9M4_9DINO|nr:unnamed protein product [Polarella glacialis]